MPISKKKLRIFGCLLFISCIQVLSSWALESFSTILEHEGSKPSKSLTMQDQEIHARLEGVNGTVGLHGEQKIFEFGKSQRGKGSYGGANIAHRPRPTTRSSAPSLLANPIFVSTFICYISFGLIPAFPF